MNIEVVAGDNTSSNGTKDVASAYAGKLSRLLYLRHGTDAGCAANRSLAV
jgi:hypothetical protein